MTRIAVLGGGIVGLGVTWHLARRGFRVVVVDTELPGRSSSVAAGMISAAAEIDHGEPDLWDLTSRAQRMWPGFATDLERSSGRPAGLRRTGTLLVAADRDEDARLERRLRLLRDVDTRVELLDRAQLRRREPALAATVRRAAWLPDDFCVDRSTVTGALRAAAGRAGAQFIDGTGSLVDVGGQVVGVRVADEVIHASHVVLCAGWRSTTVAPSGLLRHLTDAASGLRPVKGELIDLRLPTPAVHAMIRSRVDRVPIYLVPHDEHHLTVGATSEEVGADTTTTVRAALDLLTAACAVVPELRDAAIIAHRVGLRPAMADNRPLLGVSPAPGLTIATGHYRHGFLLAPVTAEVVGDHVIRSLDPGGPS